MSILWSNACEDRTPVRLPFILLCAFLCIVFFTGGSSWANEPRLIVLRPAALLIAAIGILTVDSRHLRRHGWLICLFLVVLTLTIAHLVPVPFAWWSALPGRSIIVGIDTVARLGMIDRPLSMAPDGTMNALVSLSVPFAVLVLAIQLDMNEHKRLITLVLALATLSGLIGALQASGLHIAFYSEQATPSGLFTNRNHQGTLLAMIFPIAMVAATVGFGLGLTDKIEKFLALSIGVISVPLVLITGSRAGLLIAAAAILSLPLLWYGDPLRTGDRARRATKAVAALLVLGGIVWITVLSSRDIALSRIWAAEDDLRWPVWHSVVQMIPVYWPYGTGIGSYADAYQILEPDELLRPTHSNHAHNEWLEILFTAGFPGLVLTIAFLLTAFYYGFKSLVSLGHAAIVSRMGVIMIAILALASTVDYPLHTPTMAALLTLAGVWASSWAGYSRSGI